MSAKEEPTDEIIAMVGREGFARLEKSAADMAKRMEEISLENMIQNEVGIDLEVAGMPLSAEQRSALARAYIDAHSTPNLSLSGTPPRLDPTTGLTPFFEFLLNRATAVLSAGQLTILKQVFSEQTQAELYFVKLIHRSTGK
jgi:hypothetical protein